MIDLAGEIGAHLWNKLEAGEVAAMTRADLVAEMVRLRVIRDLRWATS